MYRFAAFAFVALTACHEGHPALPDASGDTGAAAITDQARASTLMSDAQGSSLGEQLSLRQRFTVGQSTKDDVLKVAGRPLETSSWKSGKGKCVELWYWGGAIGGAVYFDSDGVVCMISDEGRD